MSNSLWDAALSVGLFDDMARAFYEVYENESKYDQYTISVFFLSEDLKILLTTETIKLNQKTNIEKETLESYFGKQLTLALEDLQRNRLALVPEMYIINSYMISDEDDVRKFINRFYSKKNKPKEDDMVFEMHTNKAKKTKVFVYINVNDLIEVPDIVIDVAQKIYQSWNYYFLHCDDFETYIPICRINNLIESQYPVKKFFPVITEISSKYYEKKRCSGKIIITSDKQQDKPLIPLTGFHFTDGESRMLRKLVEMTNVDLALLVDSKGELYGIGKDTNVSKDKIKAIFRILNHLEWEMYNATWPTPILKFKHGKYYLPYDIDIEKSYIVRKTNNMPIKTKELICKIIASLRGKGHGALVIVSSDAEDETKRLCKYKCGVLTKPKALPADDKANAEILSALTSVDGAVFLDENGVYYGFGMILDGDTYISGSPDRGSRLNSARRYIARKKKSRINACAIILSDDGYVNIVSGYDMGVRKDGSVYDK